MTGSAPLLTSQPTLPKASVVLSPTMSVPAAVQRIIKAQTAIFERMLPIALIGENIEGVHKVRVSLRRMRTILKVTRPYFKKKNLVATRIDLKFVRQVFGRVRDMDVFKQDFSHHFAKTRPGLNFSDTVWLPVFDPTYQDYTSQINSLVTQEIIDQLRHTLADYQSIELVLKNPDKLSMIPPDLRTFLPIILKSQLDGILAFELSEEVDRNYPHHHQLRLLVKAHRYTYEFFLSVLDQHSATEAINKLIEIQDHLGELNDSVQAIRFLSTHQSPRLSNREADTLKTYIEFQWEKQNQLVSTFPRIWEDFRQSDFQKLLTKSISTL